jgi:HK97 family phage prohead protease
MSAVTLTRADLEDLYRLGRLDPADDEVRRMAGRLLLTTQRTAPSGFALTRAFSLQALPAAKKEGGVLTGLASVYGTPYEIGDGYREQIEPGAFARSLARQSTVPVSWQHLITESGPIGSAEMRETLHGLHMTAHRFLTSDLGDRVFRTAAAGALTALSIAFVPAVLDIERAADGGIIDHVVEASLYEVAIVVRGANPDAQIASTN